MTTDVISREQAVIRRLQESYEQDGYVFLANPPSDIIPGFLGRYRPDAIAQKADHQIVIEVKIGRQRKADPRLSEIAKMVSTHPGWEFRVYFVDDFVDPEGGQESDVATRLEIDDAIQELEKLVLHDHYQAAFRLGWSILESVVRLLLVAKKPSVQPHLSSLQVIQALEMDGHIEGTIGAELRELGSIRNKLAHGGIHVRVDRDIMKRLQDLIEKLAAVVDSPQGS